MKPVTPKTLAQAIKIWAKQYRHGAPAHEVVEDYFRDVLKREPPHALIRQIRREISRSAGRQSAKMRKVRNNQQEADAQQRKQYKLL
jgi:hypothetical protein